MISKGQSGAKKPSATAQTLRQAFRWAAVAAVVLFSLGKLEAQQVQATLSGGSTTVGRPVQLTVKITGARAAQLPKEIKVEGLDVRFAGQGEEIAWRDSQLSTSSTYTYLVIPFKAGDYTIPSISFSAGGKSLQTDPLKLSVTGASAALAPPAAQPAQASPNRAPGAATAAPATSGPAPATPSAETIAFGQLIVPKATAYVGEVVPVELRFFYDARFQSDTSDHPSFSGDGFTVLTTSKRSERQQQIGDRVFNVFVFQTAITPVKTGPLEIPAATLDSAVVIPTSNSDPNDLFGGLFQRNETKRGSVPTTTAKLEVKALPQEGKPEDFGGAVGQFSIQAAVSPKKAAVGDPVTLKVTIAGRGNFEAMGDPTLLEADGWRTYPPSVKFESSATDPIGYNGQKQFEYTMMAREDQTKTPMAEFSFFDPSIAKYVTLKSAALPIDAKGGGTPPAPATAVATSTATPAPTASAAPTAPTSTPSAEDSLSTESAPGSFQPFFFNRTFLIANGALGVIWLGALLVGFGRAVSSSAYAKESAAHRERRKLLDRMDSTDMETRQFLTLGAEFVRARLEAKGPVVNLRDSLESAPLLEETKTTVATLLDKADELNYAAGSTEAKVGPEERKKIVASLKEFDNELQKAR